MNVAQGIIIKGIGGFYYVEAAEGVYECKARGAFRKKGYSPCAGDIVDISIPQEGYCSIENILPRRNSLIRPALANIDQLVIVVSTCDPSPNLLVIDKMTATAVNKNIEPIIVVSKTDLSDGEQLKSIYHMAGIKTVLFSAVDKTGAEAVKALLPNKVTAFTGNSGVGKSSLLNCLFPDLGLETGVISQKLGRGRHTTRSVELYSVAGGYVADTPGFSTVDLQRYDIIDKNDMAYCFPEFEEYFGQCQFISCAHICEKGCAVLQAVKDGKISHSRHNSYVEMYNEVKDIKDWQKR
ncbi:MAG TPA: ribosome small subunit-dependent GTPase A [Clostridiales bacterium]|nr:ribosome small subunit-dependent GTPase A [Clostridiales bacterium]